MAGLYRTDLRREAIPGVYVVASAVNDLLRRDAVRSLGRVADRAIAVLLTMLAGVVVVWLSPLRGAALVLALGWAPLALVSIPQIGRQDFAFSGTVWVGFAYVMRWTTWVDRRLAGWQRLVEPSLPSDLDRRTGRSRWKGRW